jgi:NAD(P)-dependent dehydrogenase (short-subunit alcohol dehydrogenase family)
MNLGLRGHVALVVGGTGLIGRAIVERLRTEGATAVAAARHVVDGITLDAQDSASVTAALEQVIEQHGRLDALVVAAAPSAQTLDASRHADPDQVLAAVDAKAMSFLRLANAALPIMARGRVRTDCRRERSERLSHRQCHRLGPQRRPDHRRQESRRQRRRIGCHGQHRQPRDCLCLPDFRC